MVFRAGLRDPCTWDVARLSESGKIHTPAVRVFLRFPKLSQRPACMDHAILHGKPFSNPLFSFSVECFNGNTAKLLWQNAAEGVIVLTFHVVF